MTIQALMARVEGLRASERAAEIRAWAERTGQPLQRVYAQLRTAGWSSGRRRRSDAGGSKVSAEHLRLVAAMLLAGVRGSGQRTTSIPMALSVLRKQGVEIHASPGQVARLLRQRGMDVRTQRARTSHAPMRSAHPNHVHQVDASVCTLYYLRGRQRDVATEAGYEPYKNKDSWGDAKKLKLWRYVVTDHASGCFYVRYYEQAGESSEALWDVLMRSWGGDPRRCWYGVPKILIWDKGSENRAIREALEQSLGMEVIAHKSGNPRAKGGVESAMWMIEQGWESRLRFQHLETVDELNDRVSTWANLACENALDGLDTRVDRRVAMVHRADAWRTITPDQLVALPPDARDFAMHQEQTRQVQGDLAIPFAHPLAGRGRYDVSGLQGVAVGRKVRVRALSMRRDGAVRVRSSHDDRDYEAVLLPIAHDRYGRREDAVLYGADEWRSTTTDVERTGAELRDLAGEYGPGAEPFGGQIRAVDAGTTPAAEASNVIAMPRVARAIESGGSPHLTVVQIARLWRERLGEAWTDDMLDEIAARWPAGCAENEAMEAMEANFA